MKLCDALHEKLGNWHAVRDVEEIMWKILHVRKYKTVLGMNSCVFNQSGQIFGIYINLYIITSSVERQKRYVIAIQFHTAINT